MKKSITISLPSITGDVAIEALERVVISVVAYKHQQGTPARFFAGLVPAILLCRELTSQGFDSTIRLIDPSPIANYCNGWEESGPALQNMTFAFLDKAQVKYYVDRAEPLSSHSLELLIEVGARLKMTSDEQVRDMVERIEESGRRHGGEQGKKNALIYIAAHPFSWLCMYHPLVWKRQHSPKDATFINLMSKPESRFTTACKFLQIEMPHLATGLTIAEYYMAVCNTPCYIPLPDEPTMEEFMTQGSEECHERYRKGKKRSTNHLRALRDFEFLLSFLKQ